MSVAWLDCTGCATSRDFASDAEVQAADGGVAGGDLVRQTTERARDAAATADAGLSVVINHAMGSGDRDAEMPVIELEAGYQPGPVRQACLIDEKCRDGNPCNGDEQCVDGYCASVLFVDEGVCEGEDGEPRVCRGGNCLESRCGDGVTDSRSDEDCDDGNGVVGDGCEQDCTFSCDSEDDCTDGNLCNGSESCDLAQHVCVPGEALADDAPCGDGHACRDGRCLSVTCGDYHVDTGEECDDGNVTGGDGCDPSCVYECNQAADCDDGNVCNGSETCDTETHICLAGAALDCNDHNACTDDLCDPMRGCSPVLVDQDRDGQAPSSIEGCGTDCNDADPKVFTGAGELCDGIDNNCDGRTDEVGPTWYPDCDGDGYAQVDAEGVQQCDIPSSAPGGCARGSKGGWTSRPPKEGADCWDADPAIYPRSDAVWSDQAIAGRADLPFDYNCDGVEDQRWRDTSVSTGLLCASIVASDPILDLPLANQQAAAAPCGGKSGWAGSRAPACGQPGTYSYCNGCVRAVVEGYLQQCE